VTAQRKAERAEAFVAPIEEAEPTVQEKVLKKRKRAKETVGDEGENADERRKHKREKRRE
jgi:ribosomal RNA assembly protein